MVPTLKPIVHMSSVRSNSALLSDASSSLRCACGGAKRGR